jgi:formylglycine-generating enzyme required for sulfatase activity
MRLAPFAFALGLSLSSLAATIGCVNTVCIKRFELQPGSLRHDERGVGQVWVPPGRFVMGTDETTRAELAAQDLPRWVAGELASECPAHEVEITRGFWIDRCEVSNSAFAAFVEDGGYARRELWSEPGWSWLSAQPAGSRPAPAETDGPQMPLADITWYEAEAYARWRGGRLPTEAEWEYAARGPQSRRYPWGDDFEATRCQVVDAHGPAEIGMHLDGASWVNAQDMSGNLMEWVADWLDVGAFARDAAGGVVQDPTGPATGQVKVEKGGWWGGPAFAARGAYRHFEDPPSYADHHIGVRVVTPVDG